MNTFPIAVVGSGRIGYAAARHFVRAGHGVWLTNSRGPDSLRDAAERLGYFAQAATSADAVRAAEVVLLAVPWKCRFAAVLEAGGAEAFAGKIVIDAINPHAEFPIFDDLGACASSEAVALLIGRRARLVKAFNTLREEILTCGAQLDLPTDERIAIPLCGDDPEAKHVVCSLIEEIGFAPVDIGTLVFSHLLEPHRSLYDVTFTPPQVRKELIRYERGQKSN